MTLHLIKLSVGSESLETFTKWVDKRRAELKKAGRKPEMVHVTRMTPKRKDELLDGGSLYWVIKGQIVCRTRLLDLRPVTRGGTPHCGLVFEPKVVPVLRRHHRPFQGWRYFDPKNAPPDIAALKGGKGLAPELRQELSELGLL